MASDSHHDACPTCRQPLFDPAAYKVIAATFCEPSLGDEESEDDGILEENDDSSTRHQAQQHVEERSQQFRFRLAYFILAAVVLQITVFSIFIYTGNYNFPAEEEDATAATLGTSSNRSSTAAPACIDPLSITNATLQAQCQYARTCRVPMVASWTDCHCLCWRYGSTATLYDATKLCVCEKRT